MAAKPKSEPAKGEQFIKLPRDLLRSHAWRSQSINCRRLIDFLMVEEMGSWRKTNGAAPRTDNGRLKAPYRQLVDFGIGARLIADAVREAERLGLILVHRQGLKVATMYAITWMFTYDGKAPTNEWAGYRNPDLTPLPEPKIQKSASPS